MDLHLYKPVAKFSSDGISPRAYNRSLAKSMGAKMRADFNGRSPLSGRYAGLHQASSSTKSP